MTSSFSFLSTLYQMGNAQALPSWWIPLPNDHDSISLFIVLVVSLGALNLAASSCFCHFQYVSSDSQHRSLIVICLQLIPACGSLPQRTSWRQLRPIFHLEFASFPCVFDLLCWLGSITLYFEVFLTRSGHYLSLLVQVCLKQLDSRSFASFHGQRYQFCHSRRLLKR